MKGRVLFWIFATVLLLAIAWFWRPKTTKTPSIKVANFEECAQAGYPVLQTYPRECRTPGGQSFFEIVKR